VNPIRREVDYLRERRADISVGRTPPAPGRQAMLLAALTVGALLLAIQLWLLTVALEIYLGGTDDGGIWVLAAFSGLVFLGGLFVIRLLSRRARLQW
jgi:hypothetical protein